MSGANSTTEAGVTQAAEDKALATLNAQIEWLEHGKLDSRVPMMAVADMKVLARMAAQSRQPSPAQAEPKTAVDKNHLPDLRYIRQFLLGLADEKHRSGDLAAAITGINYIIKRTETATGAAEGAEPTADAERYRWLREQSHPWGSRWLSRDQLDSAIDAARAAQKGQP